MITSQADDASGDRRQRDKPKIRRCLRCSTEFPSAWSGERICVRCKSTAAWRQGAPAPSRAVGRRR
jgi:hypothetical protein